MMCAERNDVAAEPQMKGFFMYNKLQKAIKSIREKTDFVPEIAIILGSGLGDFADNIRYRTLQ